ncbi:MAG: NeuD/PglB/VioB family sugar acetyltransferase [Candidatus Omnitrophica bacterium]|nr:NeuD/PglB/VioB family sugar acetyltransferase [Candidatus Omnitrophota bacterium]
MPKKIALFPFGGNAREALLPILAANAKKKEWDVLGFIDDDPKVHGKDCLGVKVLGGREVLGGFPGVSVLAVPGNPKSFSRRREIIESLGLDDKRFATIIDPSVVVSPDARIGRNVLLMANVVVSCGVTIGDHCIVLPNTSILHDTVIGDYTCVGSNVSISGGVRVGAGCYIGSGSRIKESVSVKEGALIGLGANVISDIDGGVVAVGNPARVIRKAE